MSFDTFKTEYLSEAESRLDVTDLSAAGSHEIMLHGALYKMAGSVADTAATQEATEVLAQAPVAATLTPAATVADTRTECSQ